MKHPNLPLHSRHFTGYIWALLLHGKLSCGNGARSPTRDSHLTLIVYSKSSLLGDLFLTGHRKHRGQPCSPAGPGQRGTFESSGGMRAAGWDHWKGHTLELCISVFTFLLHFSLAQISLLHLVFSRLRAPVWDTYHWSLWYPEPRSFCPVTSSDHFNSMETDVCKTGRKSESFKKRCNNIWRHFQNPWLLTRQERHYIKQRISSIATFCVIKALSQVGVDDFTQGSEVLGWLAVSLEMKEWLWPCPTS